MAVAAAPDPARFGRGNGWLSFDWLLETGPGTAYSVGLACVTAGVLVRWTRDQAWRTLLLALAATFSCLLVRFNTFLWLAPTVALGCVLGWRQLDARARRRSVIAGLVALTVALAALSWESLRDTPRAFMFDYVNAVQSSLGPIDFPSLEPWLRPRLGRVGAGTVSLGLTLLETAGWWLPLYAALAWSAKRRGRMEPADWIPGLLLAVATISILLAPVARNGDTSEFRHRAGALLPVFLSIWTLHLAGVAAAPRLRGVSGFARGIALAAAASASMSLLWVDVSQAKRPRMPWSGSLYDLKSPPQLERLAPSLAQAAGAKGRFAVARQPADSREIDDAARLVALSGVPAYVSCPKVLLSIGGALGAEAQRRLEVIDRLDHATDLETLRRIMRENGVTAYVARSPGDAAFDPGRLAAVGHEGDYAVYSAASAGPEN